MRHDRDTGLWVQRTNRNSQRGSWGWDSVLPGPPLLPAVLGGRLHILDPRTSEVGDIYSKNLGSQ